jgi:hypothetical protein
MEVKTVRGTKVVIQEKASKSEWPERRRALTPRGALAETMSQLKPGEFCTILFETRKDMRSLQNNIYDITVQLGLPNGSFSSRALHDEKSGEYALYVRRNKTEGAT